MDTPENNSSAIIPENPDTSSLLAQIIQTSHESNIPVVMTADTTGSTDVPVSWGIPPIKKPRDPLTAGTVLKMIGSLLLVTVIFFGSFLAYIVFNPEQAGFFVSVFNINQNDIRDLLKNLIYGSFGSIVLVLSIVWIISLFRAIWTPREQKRRRLISWLIASMVGILLFSIVAFWSYLFSIIKATDYANTDGEVTIYDNDLYVHTESKEYARISSTNNLVGPITLKYDLSTNVKAIAKKNLLTIESYEINFDGAKCINGESSINGSNPLTEQWLICTFDQVRTYNIRGTYKWKDRLGQIQTITMPLNTIKINWLIDVSITTNKDKKKVITLNAARVKNLWNPRWLYAARGSIEKAQTSITEEVTSTPLMVCLKLISNVCDRYFIITDTDVSAADIEWSIAFNQDSTNSLGVIMTLTGVNISNNEIVNIDWIDTNGSRLCQGTSEKCEHSFTSYGTKTVVATILLANKKIYTVQGSVVLNKPLLILQHAKIFDQDNKLLNPEETFDARLGSYVIKDIAIPMKLTLDARDIVLENSGYKIRNVTWKISHNGITDEKIGEKVIYELPQTVRYTIEAIYTFEKNSKTIDSDNYTTKDTIIIDLEHKSLEPILTIQQTSDYAPSKITFDASSSQSKNGNIKKFIYDFDEGRPLTEGDAIQVYEYRTAWEKKITLTIINDNNEEATITKYVVLKDTPKNIVFTTSMTPIINTPVNFTAEGTTGDIEEWIWNFWDNTPVAKWYEVTHSYSKTGSFLVTMTVRYVNGTEKSANKTFQVESTLE